MITKNISQACQGRMRWMVVDSKTQEVVRESGWIKNLILNLGMNRVAVNYYADCFTYCVAGTGVTPTNQASGATTAVQSGSSVTLSGGTFTFTDTATDAGKIIKWDSSGEEATIVTVISPTSVTVSNSASVGSNTFVVYLTQQTGLTTEVKRTNTYLTGLGNCGTTYVGATGQHRRTFDFSAEVGTVVYTEVGFSWAASPGNNLFSRLLLPAPVTVNASQQLRIVYELWVTLVPSSPASKTAIITGWSSTTGNEQVVGGGLATIATSGLTNSSFPGVYGNEPSLGSNLGVYLSTDSSAPATFNTGDDRSPNAAYTNLIAQAYVSDTYTRDKTAVFDLNTGNRSDWRSMGYGYHGPNVWFAYQSNYNCYVFVFDNPQEKLNTHTLTLTFRWSWSRVLS
jgi:hypothetical protein